jgi:SAM-dependent methyltransferase
VLEEGQSVPFLIKLGVMNEEGKVYPKQSDKFRQINRFLEMVQDVLPHLSRHHKLQIVDFGCGKAYLTFALHHYLTMQGFDFDVMGLDLKEDVIALCQELAHQLGCKGLSFALGDINQYQTDSKVDMVVSLHACDTATDAALEKAIRWQADVILCVPCCQHELFNQIKNADLQPLLKHGSLKERFSALATDAARAQLLELLGYHVQVVEFIDLEHTPKSLLIRATKKEKNENQSKLWEAYKTYKQSLQINPSLEKRFRKEWDAFQSEKG